MTHREDLVRILVSEFDFPSGSNPSAAWHGMAWRYFRHRPARPHISREQPAFEILLTGRVNTVSTCITRRIYVVLPRTRRYFTVFLWRVIDLSNVAR